MNDFEGWSFAIFLLLMLELISLYGASELILPATDEPRVSMLDHFKISARILRRAIKRAGQCHT